MSGSVYVSHALNFTVGRVSSNNGWPNVFLIGSGIYVFIQYCS